MASLENDKSGATGKDSKPKLIQMLAAMKKEEKRLKMLIEYTKPVDILAKIGPGPAATATSQQKEQQQQQQQQQPVTTAAKRQCDADTTAATEVKKPRVLGPSLPPPS
jgi:hypothetical protein